MSKVKITLLIIVIVCVITVVCLWVYYSSQTPNQPEFEIVEFQGLDTPLGYQITFKVNNTGTGDATGVHGTLNVTKLWQETWSLISEDQVLKPGETSHWIVIFLGSKPTKLSITAIVECDEGVTRQFTDLSP